MAVTAHDVQILHDYANGVMARADHHAGEVKAVALTILGGIIWRAEPGSIEIKQYAGDLANVLWFVVNRSRYAVAYNHVTNMIEVRDRTINGSSLYAFDNSTRSVDVEAMFRAL